MGFVRRCFLCNHYFERLSLALWCCAGGLAGISSAGCSKDEGGCYFAGEKCLHGEPYTGDGAKAKCDSDGGKWVDTCPIDETCIGKCTHETYWIYVYKPDQRNQIAAKADCSGEWTNGCGDVNTEPLSYLTSSCTELDGTVTGSGACSVACSKDYPVCAPPTFCWTNGWNLCWPVLGKCTADADCGSTGWWCDTATGNCFLTCTTDTVGAQSPECPVNWKCYHNTDHGLFLCANGAHGGGCQVTCPAGCCSTSGSSCCQPPYCSGDCAGSPCCI
jgi:hypothetical protein